MRGLVSAEPGHRRAALQCQRALCELQDERKQHPSLVPTLFDLLEMEPSAEAMAEAKRTLLDLLHAGSPSFWLKTIKGVVLMDKKKKEKRHSQYDARGEEGEGEGEEEGGEMGASGLPAGDSTEESEESRRRQKEMEMESEEAAKWEFIAPRWQTRLFAVECVGQLLSAHCEPAHFSLRLAREVPHVDLLVLQLSELISIAFTAATGAVEAIRPAGIITLIDIVCKFGGATDPDYEGHLLLEQYHAQIAAALRPCFSIEAEPSLAASGCALASRYTLIMASTAHDHQVDPVAVRKLVALLTKMVTEGLHQIQFPTFSESAATMVRAAVMQAVAQLQQAASRGDVPEVSSQLGPSLPSLRDSWMALLRDFSFLRTQHSRGRAYRPHLYSSSCAAASRERLIDSWAPVLDAVSGMVGSAAWEEGRPGTAAAQSDTVEELAPITARPAREDVDLLVGLTTYTLARVYQHAGEPSPSPSSEELEACISCVRALQRLLIPGKYLSPAALPSTSLLSIVSLLQRVAENGSPRIRESIARLSRHLNAGVGEYMHGSDDAFPLLSALQRLASTPLFLALPYLASPHSLESVTIAPISAEDVRDSPQP